jgi:hypothetical protein
LLSTTLRVLLAATMLTSVAEDSHVRPTKMASLPKKWEEQAAGCGGSVAESLKRLLTPTLAAGRHKLWEPDMADAPNTTGRASAAGLF